MLRVSLGGEKAVEDGRVVQFVREVKPRMPLEMAEHLDA